MLPSRFICYGYFSYWGMSITISTSTKIIKKYSIVRIQTLDFWWISFFFFFSCPLNYKPCSYLGNSFHFSWRRCKRQSSSEEKVIPSLLSLVSTPAWKWVVQISSIRKNLNAKLRLPYPKLFTCFGSMSTDRNQFNNVSRLHGREDGEGRARFKEKLPFSDGELRSRNSFQPINWKESRGMLRSTSLCAVLQSSRLWNDFTVERSVEASWRECGWPFWLEACGLW